MVTRKTVQVSAPLPNVAPLGTKARAEVAKEMFPGIGETEATVVALSSQVVQLEEQLAQANARIDTLRETMVKLVEYVMTNVTTQVEAPAPTPAPQPKVAPAAKAPAKVAEAIVPPSPQATARVATAVAQAKGTPAKVVPFAEYPKVCATFDSFLTKGLEFSPRSLPNIDANLATDQGAYLRQFANAWLATYKGTNGFVQKIAALPAERRSVPQLRGCLNVAFSLYRTAVAKG